MNIHGHKLKIAKINAEMKHEKDLGNQRVNILKRRKIMHQHLIEKLRKNKKVKVKKRRR